MALLGGHQDLHSGAGGSRVFSGRTWRGLTCAPRRQLGQAVERPAERQRTWSLCRGLSSAATMREQCASRGLVHWLVFQEVVFPFGVVVSGCVMRLVPLGTLLSVSVVCPQMHRCPDVHGYLCLPKPFEFFARVYPFIICERTPGLPEQ